MQPNGGGGHHDSLHLYIHLDQPVMALLQAILNQGSEILATLDDESAAVSAEGDVVTSVVALLDGLSAQLAAAIAAADPAAIQAVVDSINAQKQQLADAVVANTPAAPAAPA